MSLPKGISTNKHYPGKYTAQYWDISTHFNKFIGVFNTIEEAAKARQDYINNLIEFNGKVLKKDNPFPKGIKGIFRKRKGWRYYASIQFWYGKNKDTHISFHLGTYDTIEEAVQARIDYLDSLK